jgi:thiol:disulfide interchange protein DsbC
MAPLAGDLPVFTFATLRRSTAVLALALLAPIALAQPAPERPPTAEAAALKKLLEQRFPGAPITNVSKTAYGGLYEALLEDRLIYTDAKASYILIGNLYDAASKRNLTEERQRKLNRVAWDQLPLDLAIKKVKGTGARKLAVFSDADCPFCARLENDLKSIDNVTIYTFLFPIDQLHPDAARKSRQIWCAPDRQKAWDAFFESGTVPDNKGDCKDPIQATAALGQKLRVTATPTLVFADGSVIPGALPAQQLELEFSNAEAELKKLAAAKK